MNAIDCLEGYGEIPWGGREAVNNKNLSLEVSRLALRFWVLRRILPYSLVIFLPCLPTVKGKCSSGISLVRAIILVIALMT